MANYWILVALGLALFVQVTWTAESCKFKADVAFLLDDSASVNHRNFKDMVNFVKDVERRFDVRQGAVHIAVGTFSRDGKVNFNFGGVYTMKSVLDKTQRVVYRNGKRTRTNLGLKAIREQAFARKGRKGVPQILIIITDGEAKNYQLAVDEANKLKRAGVTIFTCGVGRKISRRLLKAMASKDQYVVSALNFGKLAQLAKPLFDKTCQAPAPTPKAEALLMTNVVSVPEVEAGEKTQKFDLIFGVDNLDQPELLYQVIDRVLPEYKPGEMEVRVGVYTTVNGTDIPLGQAPANSGGIAGLLSSVNNTSSGEVDLLDHLQRVIDAFNASSRLDTQNVYVLIGHFRMDGLEPEPIREMLDILKALRVDIIAFLHNVSPDSEIGQTLLSASINVFPFNTLSEIGCLTNAFTYRLRAGYKNWLEENRDLVPRTCLNNATGQRYEEGDCWSDRCVTFKCVVEGVGKWAEASADVLSAECPGADGLCHVEGEEFRFKANGKMYNKSSCKVSVDGMQVLREYTLYE